MQYAGGFSRCLVHLFFDGRPSQILSPKFPSFFKENIFELSFFCVCQSGLMDLLIPPSSFTE